MATLDYSPSVKYHIPRLYRERAYGGVGKKAELSPSGAYYPTGMQVQNVSCRIGEAYVNIPAEITLENTRYGQVVRSNQSASVIGLFPQRTLCAQYAADMTGHQLTAAWSGYWHSAADATNQYFMGCGSYGTPGWYLRKHSAHYVGLFTLNSGGQSIGYTAVGSQKTADWNTWIARADAINNSARIVKDAKDVTYSSACRQPGANDGLPSLYVGQSISLDASYARAAVYDRQLSVEESSMWDAGLM